MNLLIPNTFPTLITKTSLTLLWEFAVQWSPGVIDVSAALIWFCPVPSVSSFFLLDSICFSLLHFPLVCNSLFLCPACPFSFDPCPCFSPIPSRSSFFHFLSQTVWTAFLSSQSHKANSHAVRFRVCQLINKLLGSMAENAQIDDDLFDRIHQAMLVRVTDKFPNVRIQAALAMTRLQQPKDPDCPTINGLCLFFYPCIHCVSIDRTHSSKCRKILCFRLFRIICSTLKYAAYSAFLWWPNLRPHCLNVSIVLRLQGHKESGNAHSHWSSVTFNLSIVFNHHSLE